MSDYVKLANGAGDQFLTALAEGQEAVACLRAQAGEQAIAKRIHGISWCHARIFPARSAKPRHRDHSASGARWGWSSVRQGTVAPVPAST